MTLKHDLGLGLFLLIGLAQTTQAHEIPNHCNAVLTEARAYNGRPLNVTIGQTIQNILQAWERTAREELAPFVIQKPFGPALELPTDLGSDFKNKNRDRFQGLINEAASHSDGAIFLGANNRFFTAEGLKQVLLTSPFPTPENYRVVRLTQEIERLGQEIASLTKAIDLVSGKKIVVESKTQADLVHSHLSGVAGILQGWIREDGKLLEHFKTPVPAHEGLPLPLALTENLHPEALAKLEEIYERGSQPEFVFRIPNYRDGLMPLMNDAALIQFLIDYTKSPMYSKASYALEPLSLTVVSPLLTRQEIRKSQVAVEGALELITSLQNQLRP